MNKTNTEYIKGKSTPPRFINDKKVEDHHAIIPTGAVVKNLSDNEQKIFNFVWNGKPDKIKRAYFYNEYEFEGRND
mgnify:CR=1 FL=1